jgi:curved DNA-binding protein CbpA
VTDRHQSADLYSVLGVPATAGAAELARAYRRRLREIHPDTRHRRAGEPDDAPADLQALQEAYLLLRDPTRRARYDAGRRDNRPAAPHRDDGTDRSDGPYGLTDATPRVRTAAWVYPSATGSGDAWIRVGPVRIEPLRWRNGL